VTPTVLAAAVSVALTVVAVAVGSADSSPDPRLIRSIAIEGAMAGIDLYWYIGKRREKTTAAEKGRQWRADHKLLIIQTLVSRDSPLIAR
jgi:hypothetical protein